MKIENRFFKNRYINPSTNCWEWIGYKNDKGYGSISFKGIPTRVHRLAAYIWLDFDLDSKLLVCHHCDNPSCFNPEHLFIGTNTDNSKDMVNKNRQQKGEKHHKSKLTEDDVYAIKDLYKIIKNGERKYSIRKLGKLFNIHHSVISKIIKGKIWKMVN